MPRTAFSSSNIEGLPISEAVRAGDFVFVSGMVGFGPDGQVVPGGIAAETDRIMLDLADLLKRAGASLRNVVKVNVYLADAADFPAFNQAYAVYFPTSPPARVSVVTSLTIEARVEMDFVAYTGP
jgi:2-iminobutanoate/2-iminopropanoate deaminase